MRRISLIRNSPNHIESIIHLHIFLNKLNATFFNVYTLTYRCTRLATKITEALGWQCMKYRRLLFSKLTSSHGRDGRYENDMEILFLKKDLYLRYRLLYFVTKVGLLKTTIFSKRPPSLKQSEKFRPEKRLHY